MGEARKELIGWFCSYTPVELIRALGLTPLRLLPPPGKTPRADAYFTGNLCPYVKAILETALAGEFPAPAGILFVASCNAMIHLSNIWRSLKLTPRVWILDVPRRADSLAVNYWARRLKELGGELSASFSRPLEEEALWRALEEESHGPRQDGSRGERGRERNGLSPGRKTSRPRLLLVGSVLPDVLRDMVEEAGMSVVYEDACNGGRLVGERNVTGAGERSGGDPYLYLAQRYLYKPPCPRMVADRDRRRIYLREVVKTYEVQGAVYHAMKFCDLAMVDFTLVKDELEGMGIPVLKLEGDYAGGNRGQWATRLEALREML
ncbi:2-hydroxyacyl-CoA dehydratase subunit D [Thermanaeromonas sp. C210]|uniref:2-hydroxyacyl-CoA dehydratase subunit D n=1 Tax=Thermanaeromonas sp. C210 TaxID=2731925 RepID=UPI00155D1904|nr:2-hydroxyacyl-CoA dehydratase family protein [Thermanaeromonas sp. C210]GFN21895.1 2-hydroxyglutaryl-CoA dehydratase [Thermanaeromonas sp. C210]